ncbi:MAG TPA: DUF1501 domain-containing protein [Pirellulales bacterium]|nr:DUF1501 domain-containing protein [Pirellulales bacterium]
MLHADGCLQFRRLSQATRREVLSLGAATGLGLSLPALFRAREAAAASKPQAAAQSLILIYLHGGHPQHETWDPKPEAPAEVRGELGSIETALAGVRFGECLPRLARLADRLAIIRAMSHDNPNHVQASLPAMTGHAHPREAYARGDFPPSASDFPCFGAVVDHLRGAGGSLPNWVRIGPLMHRSNGTVLHGQLPGFLGDAHNPFAVNQDLRGDAVQVEAVEPRIGVERLRDRRRLLADLDDQRRKLDAAAAGTLDRFRQRAFELLSSDATQRAFDLAAEPPDVRDRYGRTQFGQACLLARRLAESGVPLVNVHYCKSPSGSWDTHGNNFRQMRDSLGPTFDQAFSALVDDLERRGSADRVTALATAEFGRTPKINRSAGRDHWPWVYSIALAGAGLKRGAVYGASDRLGAYPDARPHDPRDLAATVYHLLGIPADTVLHDNLDRPHRLVIGKPIEGVLAGGA